MAPILVLLLLLGTAYSECDQCQWYRLTDTNSALILQYPVETGNFIHTVSVEGMLANDSQSVSIYAFNEMQYLYFMIYGVNFRPQAKIPSGKYEGNPIEYHITNLSKIVGPSPKWDYTKYSVTNDPDVTIIRDDLYMVFYCNGYQSSDPEKGICNVGVDVTVTQLPFSQLPEISKSNNDNNSVDDRKKYLVLGSVALVLAVVTIGLLIFIIVRGRRSKADYSEYTPLSNGYN